MKEISDYCISCIVNDCCGFYLYNAGAILERKGKHMPKVSVIVPVYQVEEYLSECLDSILAQTFKDFELILVDDGTKDNCPAIMQTYAERDSRIYQIHKKNGGLSSARNAGLDIARGEYIAFLDSDDKATVSWLEDTVNEAERSHSELVIYNYRKFDQERVYEPALMIKNELINVEGTALESYFYDRWMPYIHGQEAWSRLYRHDVIDNNSLRFAANDQVFAEDTLFSAMYLMHTHQITALKKDYILYRQRDNSLMSMRKPHLAWRLMNLSVILSNYVNKCGKQGVLHNVLPVLCYDKLICKGIRFDPSLNDVRKAMEEFQKEPCMRKLLKDLMGVHPLLNYTLRTGKGIRTQWRGRAFAYHWLKGDIDRAIGLVEGRETS